MLYAAACWWVVSLLQFQKVEKTLVKRRPAGKHRRLSSNLIYVYEGKALKLFSRMNYKEYKLVTLSCIVRPRRTKDDKQKKRKKNSKKNLKR